MSIKDINEHTRFILHDLHKKYQMSQKNKEQSNKEVLTFSKYVIKKKLFKKHHNFHKITITPIGAPLLCWCNAKITSKFDNKYEFEGGFEIMACKCTNLITLVPHCVNYIMENGVKKYYDFTKDLDDEKFKYFLPYEPFTKDISLGKYPNKSNIQMYGKNRCKCNFNWDRL